MPLSNEVISILSGGTAGLITDVTLFPIDTIKTRLQSTSTFANRSLYKGLFSGLSTVVVASVPNAAIFFMCYEFIKNLGSNYPIGIVAPIAASGGEIMSGLFRCPFETIKQRCQDRSSMRLVNIIKHTIKDEGLFRGLYKGYFSMVAREVPFSFIQYPIWEMLKDGIQNYRVDQTSHGYDGLVCGFFAGGFSAFVTTPLDVAKTRIMLADRLSILSSMGLYRVIYQIYTDSGIFGLFRGGLARFVQISVGGAIFLGSYDIIRLKLISI